MKLLRLVVVTCVLAGSFVSSPALARQCVWNKAGFVLNVQWLLSGQVVASRDIAWGNGYCSPTDDREYTVMLSAVGAIVADVFMKGMIMVAGAGLGAVTGGAGMAAALAVAAATSAANFAASKGLKVPDGAFYIGIPSQDNYLDVWGTVWDPQAHNVGGRIYQPHAPQTPNALSTTLIGVGVDNFLYTRPTLNSKWSGRVDNSCCVKGVTVTSAGAVIGVGMDERLWIKEKLDYGWVQIPNSCCVKGIAIMPNDTIVGYTGDGLWWFDWYQRRWNHVGSAYLQSLSVTANGTLIGVATNDRLYTRQSLNSPWVEVPNDTANTSLGPIMGAAALADGTMVVIGLEKRIFAQKNLASRVQNLPNGWVGGGWDLDMISIAAGRLSIW